MSKTFKDRHDIDHDKARFCAEAWKRARTDATYAATLGFYTGVNEHGQIVSEDQAVDHVTFAVIADLLRYGK